MGEAWTIDAIRTPRGKGRPKPATQPPITSSCIPEATPIASIIERI
jgi:hypothetical protein